MSGRIVWTRERVIERLHTWAQAHNGRAPRAVDWRTETAHPDWRSGEWPTALTVRRRFGTWDAAAEAAELQMRDTHRGIRTDENGNPNPAKFSWAQWRQTELVR